MKNPNPSRVLVALLATVAALSLTLNVIDYGWWTLLIAPVVLAGMALADLLVRVLRRANAKHHQINREVLDDDPDPFRHSYRPARTDDTEPGDNR